MGIRLEPDSEGPSNDFPLAEFTETEGDRWAAQWVRIPPSALSLAKGRGLV
jgi:hypothetical protein